MSLALQNAGEFFGENLGISVTSDPSLVSLIMGAGIIFTWIIELYLGSVYKKLYTTRKMRWRFGITTKSLEQFLIPGTRLYRSGALFAQFSFICVIGFGTWLFSLT